MRDEALKLVFEAATSKKGEWGLNDEGGESRRAIRKKPNMDTDTNMHETYQLFMYGAYKYIIYTEHKNVHVMSNTAFIQKQEFTHTHTHTDTRLSHLKREKKKTNVFSQCCEPAATRGNLCTRGARWSRSEART